MAVKVGFVSLGCPKNLINTEVMLAKLAAEGFEIVAEDVDADVIVINTCAFIESAKQEAIDNILDVAWLKENHTLRGIVVTGCLPERYREQLLEEMPEVDCILGTGSYGDICEAVRSAYAKKPLARFGDVNAAPLGGELGAPPQRMRGRRSPPRWAARGSGETRGRVGRIRVLAETGRKQRQNSVQNAWHPEICARWAQTPDKRSETPGKSRSKLQFPGVSDILPYAHRR